MNKFNRMLKDESGITALETAIILIAFVVVAAIFAFTILSTGTFLTERSKEAAYGGLQEVRGSIELKGSIVLENTGAEAVFNLGNVAGGSSIDLAKVKMTYRDSVTNSDLAYNAGTTSTTGNWVATQPPANTAAVQILSAGNLAKLRVYLPVTQTADHIFSLEIKPPSGGTLLIERTCPAAITQVTDLK